ncbi:MAG: hypothetical protein ACI9MC_001273 [Kiritimatiellia bacterium]|jgi:hypothetical protein
MLLAASLRTVLVQELDTMLESFGDVTDPEAVIDFLVEQIEMYADEEGLDDIIVDLEAAARLDAPLIDALQVEMSSNQEFEYTGEEIVSLLERMCELEWEDDDRDEEELDDDEDDEDDEEDEENDDDW